MVGKLISLSPPPSLYLKGKREKSQPIWKFVRTLKLLFFSLSFLFSLFIVLLGFSFSLSYIFIYIYVHDCNSLFYVKFPQFCFRFFFWYSLDSKWWIEIDNDLNPAVFKLWVFHFTERASEFSFNHWNVFILICILISLVLRSIFILDLTDNFSIFLCKWLTFSFSWFWMDYAEGTSEGERVIYNRYIYRLVLVLVCRGF